MTGTSLFTLSRTKSTNDPNGQCGEAGVNRSVRREPVGGPRTKTFLLTWLVYTSRQTATVNSDPTLTPTLGGHHRGPQTSPRPPPSYSDCRTEVTCVALHVRPSISVRLPPPLLVGHSAPLPPMVGPARGPDLLNGLVGRPGRRSDPAPARGSTRTTPTSSLFPREV